MTQRYEVKGKIGQGGLGEVYLARDTQLDREVALKRVRPPEGGGTAVLEADLLREAKTLSALQHPNIVTIYDTGRDDKGPFVIMELLKGETLDQVIDRGALTTADFEDVVLQLLEGMVAAQALGLVHRDLKPGNVMVTWLPSGKFQMKILDFGLAKFSRSAVPQTQDQEDGIFGSIYFMAPEQFERLPLDARTDMYSLGCIFYQILTTRHPFDGTTGAEVMVSHLQHHVTPLQELRRDLPRWMADWVMWLINREMDDRPPDAQTAADTWHALKAAALQPETKSPPTVRVVGRAQQSHPPTSHGTGARTHGGTHAAARSSRPGAKRVKRRRGAGRWIIILLLLAAGAGGAWWYFDQQKKKENAPEDARTMLERLSGTDPKGDAATVAALVSLIESGGTDGTRAAAVLKKIKGPGVAEALAQSLGSATGVTQLALLEAVASAPSPAGNAALIRVADGTTGEVRGKALDALARHATAADLPAFIDLLPKMRDDAARRRFFAALESILAREPAGPGRVTLLAPLLKTAEGPARLALLHLIGASGEPDANKVFVEELNATPEQCRDAVLALKSWIAPDESLAAALLDAASAGTSDRDQIVAAWARLIVRLPALNGAAVANHLRKAAALPSSVTAKREFCAALGTLGSSEALALARELAAQPGSSDLAAAAATAVESITARQSKVVTLAKGESKLAAAHAVILSEGQDAYFSATTRYLTGWRQRDTRLAWDLIIPAAGTVEVIVVQSSTVRTPRSLRVSLGTIRTEKEILPTDSNDEFKPLPCGKFTIPQPGSWRLWIEPGRMDEGQPLVNLREVIVKVP